MLVDEKIIFWLSLLLENDKPLWYRKQVASLFKLENAKNYFIQQHVIFR